MGSAYSFILIGILRVIAFVYLVLREDVLLLSHVFKAFMQSVLAIMKIAIPAMLANLIGPITLGITIALLAEHGDSVVAGFGVVSRIEMFITMILGALVEHRAICWTELARESMIASGVVFMSVMFRLGWGCSVSFCS